MLLERQTDPRVVVGAKVAFVARFLGRRLAHTYELVEHQPDERLVMRTAQGPFPMAAAYTSPTSSGTRVTLRNRGERSAFSLLMAPRMSVAMRRATSADLARLRTLLEGRG